LFEPDFGTIAVIMLTTMCLLFLAGAPLRPFILIALMVGLGLLAMVWLSPYRFTRLISFLDPWSTQFGSGYQLTQSLIAFGRGGIDGVGLGNSMQKLFYLPEAHTDFLFAVLGEEFGLIGAFGTLSLYACIVSRLFWWASKMIRANNSFAGYFCYGVGLWIALQAAINAGVTVGLLPTKGLTLPFISYGGTSLIISSAAIGLVLRMVAESRLTMRKGRTSWEQNY
jgi:cell division protein FtsW